MHFAWGKLYRTLVVLLTAPPPFNSFPPFVGEGGGVSDFRLLSVNVGLALETVL